MTSENYLSQTPLNKFDISAACLNIETKARSNLFPWNGQFSPQFVEVMLTQYAVDGTRILDPFCGSGTVLAEAGLLGISATGIELNPAAYILARMYLLANIPHAARAVLLMNVERKLQTVLSDGWPLLIAVDDSTSEACKEALPSLLQGSTQQEMTILEAFIILLDFHKGISAPKLAKTWGKLRLTVEQLPHSKAPLVLHHADGRYPDEKKPFDLVFTSPPYINVYNYHQQYRASAEALGWDLLHVAKTEIGSNRKNRGNRFLTVIQYCLDLAICLSSLWSVTTNDARIIFVMGRESRVRGVPFFNGEIAAAIAIEAVGYKIALRQERVFTNRFGQQIFEDILHFQKPGPKSLKMDSITLARNLAATVLHAGLKHAVEPNVKADLINAIDKIQEVTPSPRYFSKSTTNQEAVNAISDTAPRKTPRYPRERQAARQ